MRNAAILACAYSYVPSSAFTMPSVRSNPYQVKGFEESKSKIYQSTEQMSEATQSLEKAPSEGRQTRPLGSQELLMLPRQYKPSLDKGNDAFPQMSHCSTAILSATPTVEVLSQAIDEAMASHPLLRCYVQGDGEPTKRIDLFEMVREGEPNPCTFVCPPMEESNLSAKDVLSVIDVEGDRDALDASWKAMFPSNIDSGSDWCDIHNGPLWKLELHRLSDGGKDSPCALVFTFNHAISDQSSANMLTDHIVSNMAAIEKDGSVQNRAVKNDVPIAMEDSVLGTNKKFSDIQTDDFSIDTVNYVAGKAAEGFKSPVILPDDASGDDREDGSGILGALTIISGNAPGGESDEDRKSTAEFRTLSEEASEALLKKCREKGLTISNALSAAMALTSSDFIDNGEKKDQSRNYKVLQSLDMRRFGAALDNCDSVACMAGSHDLMLGPIPDRSGENIRFSSSDSIENQFWEIAKESKKQTNKFIESGGPQQATRVFDFAMTISDMNNLVNLSAKSKESQGRAYSAGIVNAGVFERANAVRRENHAERENLTTVHGKYEVEEVYFATSHARSGCLYQASCLSINNKLHCTFHPTTPIVSEEKNTLFADYFIELLEIMSGTKAASRNIELESQNAFSISNYKGFPMTIASLYGFWGVTSHAGAWKNFFDSIMQMKTAVDDPADFWAALNFWIFFAVGHPILQPILWISDVLHGTPGPQIADLVPALFIAGNIAAISIISASKEIRNAVNVFALSAFVAYVGAGLDGKAGLGDFNLALDDAFNGKSVRGCPTYDEVRQKSMDDFDLSKYQGLWYEQKFHDWTQFKEVYDTTLDIKLTEDGQGWIDDFAVKGPSPESAPLSWDKSPVADGAHYFLFGRVDPKDPPGVLRESGFGVEFPNYIVDVQKDSETGEYTEAIQFQCLERGGVRVFEGINFMSRSPKMSDVELSHMHERAEMAGMNPYGAAVEQMHTVGRRDDSVIDNSWQRMWKTLGVDKLLELLAKSIEDGGR